jgi:hypothetical protein
MMFSMFKKNKNNSPLQNEWNFAFSSTPVVAFVKWIFFDFKQIL